MIGLFLTRLLAKSSLFTILGVYLTVIFQAEEDGFSRLLDELVPVHAQKNLPGKRPFFSMPKELIQLMDRAETEYTFLPTLHTRGA